MPAIKVDNENIGGHLTPLHPLSRRRCIRSSADDQHEGSALEQWACTRVVDLWQFLRRSLHSYSCCMMTEMFTAKFKSQYQLPRVHSYTARRQLGTSLSCVGQISLARRRRSAGLSRWILTSTYTQRALFWRHSVRLLSVHWTFRPHGLRRRPRRWSTRRHPYRCRGSDFRVDVETGTIYVVAELTSTRLRDDDRTAVQRSCRRSRFAAEVRNCGRPVSMVSFKPTSSELAVLRPFDRRVAVRRWQFVDIDVLVSRRDSFVRRRDWRRPFSLGRQSLTFVVATLLDVWRCTLNVTSNVRILLFPVFPVVLKNCVFLHCFVLV